MLMFVSNKKGKIGRPKLVERTKVLITTRQYAKHV